MNATLVQRCERCEKPPKLCICAMIRPLEVPVQVLVLQHPQEPDEIYGTAALVQLAVANSVRKVGLSWRNLKHALGRDANPAEWLVLFAGSKRDTESARKAGQILTVFNKRGKIAESLPQFAGIVALDGSWPQSKTLWWRNPWLLKLWRGVLSPREPSLYGKLKREPRRECLSTLEAVALTLGELSGSKELSVRLREPLELFINSSLRNL